MAKLTVLDMVQSILNDMDSDEVNSIGDTVEAGQVASIIRNTYYELWSVLNLPTRQGLIKLDGLADTDKPNYLAIPDHVKDIEWVKYDVGGSFKEIVYVSPKDFVSRLVENYNTSESHEFVDLDGTQVIILNEADPSYWTTFDNKFIVFDTYNSQADTTLHSAKSLSYGQYDPEFILADDFIPDLESRLFPTLLSEATALCFVNLKGVGNAKEEQKSRRGMVRHQQKSWKEAKRDPKASCPDYGRRRR